MTFTKLFSSITESTVWCEPDRIRLVWIAMLAMADKHGRVWASVPGLANRARVPTEDAEAAIAKFLAPDTYSRTPDYEGRRIEPIDGGWRLLNYQKYREIRDSESIKESKRKYAARERSRIKNLQSNSVERGRANAEAEAEADAIRKETPVASLPAWLPVETWEAFREMRKKIRAPMTPHAEKLLLASCERLRSAGHNPLICLNQSIERSWRGVFPPTTSTTPPKRSGHASHEPWKGL